MIRVNTHFTEKQLKALRRRAQQSGLSVAEIVRRAVDDYLKAENKR